MIVSEKSMQEFVEELKIRNERKNQSCNDWNAAYFFGMQKAIQILADGDWKLIRKIEDCLYLGYTYTEDDDKEVKQCSL